MTGYTAQRSQPPEPELGAPTPLFTSGTELMVSMLGKALAEGAEAYAALIVARDAGDKVALRNAADRLVGVLTADPKSLARRIYAAVRQ